MVSRQGETGFAILGAGMVAEHHCRAIRANAGVGARLVALGHYDPARFAAIETEFGAACTTYEELLADPRVDVVCICTPSGQHAVQTVAAAQAGKQVLVEKPMALSLADADDMIAACDRAGVKLGVAFQRRTIDLYQQVRRAIQAGHLGELTCGLVTMPYHRPQSYYDQAAWRGTWALDGGGVLMNQGIHWVDMLVWFMGDPIEVQAYAGTLHRAIEVEDVLAAILRFANGSVATITATTTAQPGFSHRIEIYGTRGAIQLDGETVQRWELSSAEPAPAAQPEAGPGAGADPRGIGSAGHSAIVRDFVEALREGRPPLVDGHEGQRSLAAVLSIYEAAGLV